jgi:hypothetical protein
MEGDPMSYDTPDWWRTQTVRADQVEESGDEASTAFKPGDRVRTRAGHTPASGVLDEVYDDSTFHTDADPAWWVNWDTGEAAGRRLWANESWIEADVDDGVKLGDKVVYRYSLSTEGEPFNHTGTVVEVGAESPYTSDEGYCRVMRTSGANAGQGWWAKPEDLIVTEAAS